MARVDGLRTPGFGQQVLDHPAALGDLALAFEHSIVMNEAEVLITQPHAVGRGEALLFG